MLEQFRLSSFNYFYNIKVLYRVCNLRVGWLPVSCYKNLGTCCDAGGSLL